VENQRAVTVLFIIGGLLTGVFFRSLTMAVMGVQAWEDPLLAGLAPLSTVIGVVFGIVGFFVLLPTNGPPPSPTPW